MRKDQTRIACACVLALAAWACSNGDENGNGTPPVCGNNRCEAGETCASCTQDCGCPAWRNTCFNGECIGCGDEVCNGDENCATCQNDCGCGANQFCRTSDNTCAPISTNPLIASMPGRWIYVEPSAPGSMVAITVDSTQPDCGYPNQTPGDACVIGFPNNPFVLLGTRLFVDVPVDGEAIEGQVLNDGTRVDYDYTELDGYHFILEKEP